MAVAVETDESIVIVLTSLSRLSGHQCRRKFKTHNVCCCYCYLEDKGSSTVGSLYDSML